LVKSDANSNIVHKDCFKYAFNEVFVVDTAISRIDHQGKTDLQIFTELAALNDIVLTMEDADKLIAAAIRYCIENEKSIAVHLLPGVLTLLEYLSSKYGIVLGLITGNIEEICYLKLDRVFDDDSTKHANEFSIKRYFSPVFGPSGKSLGAFGGTSMVRGELIVNALKSLDIEDPSKVSVFHVGDTPFDVEAAHYATRKLFSDGFRVHGVGVATGNFTTTDLAASNCESMTIVNDLSNLEELMSIFGF
jgi:phosphoglycolate phosphatase-like HAD superfamily hydrolase